MIVEGYQQGKWVPIGQVRVDKDGEVSMSLAAEFRQQHLATPVIKAGIAYIKDKLATESLVAHIKQKNIASWKAFEEAGFRFVGYTTLEGHECREYTYRIGLQNCVCSSRLRSSNGSGIL